MKSNSFTKVIIILLTIVSSSLSAKTTKKHHHHHNHKHPLFKEINADKLRGRVEKRVEKRTRTRTHSEKLLKAIVSGDNDSVKDIINAHRHLSIYRFTIDDPKKMKLMKKLNIGQGLIPLNVALLYGQEKIAEELAKNLNLLSKKLGRKHSLLNANGIAEDDEGNSPFHIAVLLGASNKLLQLFIDLGADVNDVDDDNESSLFDAVRTNNFRMVRFLVEKAKANTLILNKNGDGARAIAYKLGFKEIGDFLTATYKAKGFI